MSLVYNPLVVEYPDFSKFQITDLTGLYEVDNNPGGFGAPNPAIGDVSALLLYTKKTDPVTLLPSSDPLMRITKNVYYGATGGVLPNVTGALQDVTALSLGYTDEKLPTGIYLMDFAGVANTDGGPVNFVAQKYVLSIGALLCCFTKMAPKINLNECGACFKKGTLSGNYRYGKTLVRAAIDAFALGDYNICAFILKAAQNVCDNCIPCKTC